MQPPAERGGPLPGGESAFLGRAVSRYDVDELDDLGRRPRLERCVEVRRPDGTVAKSRGERTFYGAFTGGFSAGYWNTVGSAEGWQPASFSSSRGRREQAPAPRVEDYMDEEDLREHHASHRGVEVRAEFAPHGTGPAAASRPCAVPGGLPREVKEQVFGLKEGRIGARLLSAAASSAEPSSPALPIAEKASRPQAVDGALSKGKRRYGCAPPPPGFMPQTASELPADTTGGAESARSVLAVRHVSTSAHLITGPSGRWPFEADVERLWQGKTDLHGIGYGAAGTDRSVQQLPQHRRLYLSNKKRPHGGDASDYGAFGTGVFDMEDYDVWEDIYSKSGMPCEHEILSEPETSQEGPQAAALGPATPSALPSVSPEGCIAGFVQSKDVEDGRPDRSEWAEWELPEVPRSFRDVHIYPGTWAEEAEAGSPEHRRLLAFLEEHGRGRLLDPASRAELLGERPRGPAKAPPAEAAGGSGPSAAGAASAAGGPAPARQGAASTAEGAAAADAGPAAAAAASGPLWRGVTEEQKRALLQSLGRQFVVGRDQDMDGHLGRHEPFKSDAGKQERYAAFCLALEGRASACAALEDAGGLGAAEREAELQEFGRVYRMFRTEHPGADIAAVLEGSPEARATPVPRRTVRAWAPERLLCRRWGVPEPRPPQAPPAAGGRSAPAAPGEAPAAAGDPGPPRGAAAPGPAPAEPPRPPRTLFAAIFGDEAASEGEGEA